MCACREQAEVEVQDPKARAKANWLRVFNKVCMQLQEVSNPVPVPGPLGGGHGPFPHPGSFQTRLLPSPTETPTP